MLDFTAPSIVCSWLGSSNISHSRPTPLIVVKFCSSEKGLARVQRTAWCDVRSHRYYTVRTASLVRWQWEMTMVFDPWSLLLVQPLRTRIQPNWFAAASREPWWVAVWHCHRCLSSSGLRYSDGIWDHDSSDLPAWTVHGVHLEKPKASSTPHPTARSIDRSQGTRITSPHCGEEFGHGDGEEDGVRWDEFVKAVNVRP